jgi:uncharacterized DUF497 family protein
MNEDEFEWDAGKAEGNLEKHGVSFEAARWCSTMCLPLSSAISIVSLARSGTS